MKISVDVENGLCNPDCPYLKEWEHPYYHLTAWCWKQMTDLGFYDYYIADCIDNEPRETRIDIINSGKTPPPPPLERKSIGETKHFGDKYEKNEIISFKTLRKDEKLGKGFNVGNAAKYCARYLTEGHSKSEIKTDLYKSIHYLIFELMRKKEIETKELPF